jgi:hypothetical protein
MASALGGRPSIDFLPRESDEPPIEDATLRAKKKGPYRVPSSRSPTCAAGYGNRRHEPSRLQEYVPSVVTPPFVC